MGERNIRRSCPKARKHLGCASTQPVRERAPEPGCEPMRCGSGLLTPAWGSPSVSPSPSLPAVRLHPVRPKWPCRLLHRIPVKSVLVFACMCVYICPCVHMRVYRSLCVPTCAHACVCTYVRVHTRVYTCLSVRPHVCMHACVHVSVCPHVCICVHMSLRAHVYTYVSVCTHMCVHMPV